MGQTSIEWTATYHADGTITPGHSINPIKFRLHKSGKQVNLCTACSPGCEKCYAESITRRWWPKEEGAFPGYKAQSLKLGEFVIDESKLREVLCRKKPTKYFWCDMTDIFHPSVPFELVDQCFAVMALTPHHLHQILTKRPERMAEYLAGLSTRVTEWDGGEGETEEYLITKLHDAHEMPDVVFDACGRWLDTWNARHLGWPLPNVHLGTSVEDQRRADERIPHLLKCPASVRFLSCEPLLGGLRLKPYLANNYTTRCPGSEAASLPSVDWAIVGSESGPGRREMKTEWADQIRAQCAEAGVAFFMKQMDVDGKVSGDIDEFPESLRVRQFPVHHKPPRATAGKETA